MLNKYETAENGSLASEKLELLLRKTNIPTLPIVAQKLVEVCSDENANFSQFAQILEADQGLASRIMKVANSAYYGLRIKATTLQRAITALGLKQVKSIALGFHLAGALNQFRTTNFDMNKFWQQSILRGVLARQLAAVYCPARREEAFLIGLLQDCGIVLLVQTLGEEYARIWQKDDISPLAGFKLERSLFEFDHITAASVIAEKWSLPYLLAEPIRTHHRRSQSQPSVAESVQLCQISYFVGALAFNNPSAVDEEDLTLSDYCHSAFGLDKKEIRKLLRKTRQEFSNIAQLFAGIIPEKTDIAELTIRANNMLSDLAIDAHHRIFDCEQEIQQLNVQCKDMAQAVEYHRKEGRKDDLTRLENRSCLEEYLNETCPKVSNGTTSLTVMFIDVDNLKAVNSKYGRSAGDKLLQEFSQLLQGLFDEIGKVFRYGNDEIVVGLTGLQLKQAVKLSRALIDRVHSLRIKNSSGQVDGEICATCSIGMIFCAVGANPGGTATLLEQADNQMRLAKNSGKDGFEYQIIAGPEELQRSASSQPTNQSYTNRPQ
jgi:two-component system, cell cycle response regulator